MTEEPENQQNYIKIIVIILAIFGLSGGGYFYYQTTQDILQNNTNLEKTVLALEDKNINLADILKKEQQKNSAFEYQIGEIAGTVGKLDKLSKTDKELLQKYSKVYFLSENYVPESLVEIPSEFIYEKDKKIQIHAKVLQHLTDLIQSAKNVGINLKIISGYRSFGEQNNLKDAYTVSFGSGANKFSADQGYSEHQLGTALDFTTAELGSNFTAFEKSDAYKWFLENAYKYGFEISYPKGNTYYQYEPWHWRFVGKQLAERLYREKQNFYDLEQRQIDTYLISIFD